MYPAALYALESLIFHRSRGLVNIDLASLLPHLQMFDGQLTFDNTQIGSRAPLVVTGRAS